MLASELLHEIQTLINRHGDCRVDVETQYGIDVALSANFRESDQRCAEGEGRSGGERSKLGGSGPITDPRGCTLCV